MRLAVSLAALLLAVTAPAPAARAAEWNGIEPGVTTMEAFRARFGPPSKETKQRVGSYDTVEWTYEGARAPEGFHKMVVEFGILLPAGYSPNTVRVLRLDPKRFIFIKDTIVAGWGEPDRASRRERARHLLLQVRAGRDLRRAGCDGDEHVLHREAAGSRARRHLARPGDTGPGIALAAARHARSGAARADPGAPAGAPMIDHLLALDPGRRGIARFFVPGGAASAARTLSRGRRALVTTGFALGPGLPETDGPPGAASLGRALRALGLEVIYVTDAVTVPPLESALKVLGEPADIVTFHATVAGAGEVARRLLAEYAPSHLVAIERPGRNRAGDYLSMRAESVREWNGPLDALFLARGGRGRAGPSPSAWATAATRSAWATCARAWRGSTRRRAASRRS